MILSVGIVCAVLSPIAILVACIFEFLAKRLRRDPRCDKEKLARQYRVSDIGLVAAWVLLALAYGLSGDSVGVVILILLVLDIIYLFLRRSRPRAPGQKKKFWEV
jgi:ABC-type xylose transport system permease subunit